jgi:pilus assembly protein CpaB
MAPAGAEKFATAPDVRRYAGQMASSQASRTNWLVPLGAAALGAALLHLYLARYEAEAVGGAPRALLMVTRDLALGDVLSQGDLGVRQVPERYVEERHVLATDLARVLGARVTSSLPSGSTLRYADLDVGDGSRTLASLVRPGMRGYSLVQGASTFDGLLRAGDRVDVLWAPSEGQARAATLLENVLVLTVAGRLAEDATNADPPRRSAAVTLSLQAEQAELLAEHERQGRLLLTLRNPHDVELRAEAPVPPSTHTEEP